MAEKRLHSFRKFLKQALGEDYDQHVLPMEKVNGHEPICKALTQ
jgi:hypothetical protein